MYTAASRMCAQFRVIAPHTKLSYFALAPSKMNQPVNKRFKYGATWSSKAHISAVWRTHCFLMWKFLICLSEQLNKTHNWRALSKKGVCTYFIASCSESAEIWHADSFCSKKCPCVFVFFHKRANKASNTFLKFFCLLEQKTHGLFNTKRVCMPNFSAFPATWKIAVKNIHMPFLGGALQFLWCHHFYYPSIMTSHGDVVVFFFLLSRAAYELANVPGDIILFDCLFVILY